jgi:hypothetical protein
MFEAAILLSRLSELSFNFLEEFRNSLMSAQNEKCLYVIFLLHVILENMHVQNRTTINETKGVISSNGVEDSNPAS